MDGFKGYMSYQSWCLFIIAKNNKQPEWSTMGKMCKMYIKDCMTKDKLNKGEHSYTTRQQDLNNPGN